MNIPLLANTPPNWQVVLVDTPGTGDFNSRIAVAAEGALKSSSAYVFITTYEELDTAENASFIKTLHAHDRGMYRYIYACIRMKVFKFSCLQVYLRTDVSSL